MEKRPYNRNIQTKNDPRVYGIAESLAWISKKIGPRSRRWLYITMKAKGIEPKKNGKMSYLYESDLKILTKISTLSELVAELNNCKS